MLAGEGEHLVVTDGYCWLPHINPRTSDIMLIPYYCLLIIQYTIVILIIYRERFSWHSTKIFFFFYDCSIVQLSDFEKVERLSTSLYCTVLSLTDNFLSLLFLNSLKIGVVKGSSLNPSNNCV